MFEGGEYTKYLYLHGLSIETAEALAELHHKKMREELGIAVEDAAEIRDLFHQKYRGSRYSFGYPACPNLEDQTKLFALLKPEENVGVRLTSGFFVGAGAEHLGDCGSSPGANILRSVDRCYGFFRERKTKQSAFPAPAFVYFLQRADILMTNVSGTSGKF